MARVTTFGFSAFLRLLAQNEKPQRSAVKRRHITSKGGRNFHRSLHLSIARMLTGKASFKEVIKAARNIKKPAERRYAKVGIVRFLRWYISMGAKGAAYPATTLASPQGFFRVKFDPDCIVNLDGRRTAVHLWNSKEKINNDQALAALSLVAAKFPLTFDRPDDFAVLSLQSGDIYKWSDANKEHRKLALDLMIHLDRLFTITQSELGIPPRGDQPYDDTRPYL
ncbi:hypothetical protein HRR99_06345 [Agrobacterium vaccinii]|uniref:hypothetical protein n=1 Tax=Agrobacterium vaccinii TaxID=2735528 RepID=UPI001E3B807E|nr:hypothetical protein [Agrobacterium vaccinii]UHS61159.1 hypothetical protein HRR99_06345 [Agrobacterium vaccinii]